MPDDTKVIVIGHKNPDTDSICSAIAYAALKDRIGIKGVMAARAGNVNPQTDFVLKYFGYAPPAYLANVYPKVRDIMTANVSHVNRKTPLSSAMDTIRKENLRSIPVTDDGRPVGILGMADMAERIIANVHPGESRKVYTSISNVISSLKARPVVVFEGDEEFNASIFVGAMAEDSFLNVISGESPDRSIVIVGDRESIQQACIKVGVRLMIVTGNLDIPHEIADLARETGVSILLSPYDSATTAWLIKLSLPSERLCHGFFSATEGDLVKTVKQTMMQNREKICMVVGEDEKLCGIVTASDLLKTAPIKLILVDHNELSQAVDGAEEVDIIEVVDHHKLGNFHTASPITFINEPVGSTSTLVAGRYLQEGVEMDKGIAGLLASGIISDTVMLKSPTSTDKDRVMLHRLADTAGLDIESYAKELFATGSVLKNRRPEEIIKADFKVYEVNGKKFGVGQVEVVGFLDFYEVQADIEAALEVIKKREGFNLVGLLVTDISYGTSIMDLMADEEVLRTLGYPSIKKNLYELKGVISRKKQVVPHLYKVFTTLYGS